MGYDYSIPLELKWGGYPNIQHTLVVWTCHQSLENDTFQKVKYGVFGGVPERLCAELKDDQGAVYYSKRKPAPALASLKELGQEIETNPRCPRRLILTMKNVIDGKTYDGLDWENECELARGDA